MQLAWHNPATMIHETMFGVFFVLALIVAVVVLYRSYPARRSPALNEASRRWERAYLVIMVLLGWGTVFSGTFWAYPGQLLASGSSIHSRSMESRELVAWIATVAMTMFAYVLLKYRDQSEEHRRLRGIVAAFALLALLVTGIANGMPVFLSK